MTFIYSEWEANKVVDLFLRVLLDFFSVAAKKNSTQSVWLASYAHAYIWYLIICFLWLYIINDKWFWNVWKRLVHMSWGHCWHKLERVQALRRRGISQVLEELERCRDAAAFARLPARARLPADLAASFLGGALAAPLAPGRHPIKLRPELLRRRQAYVHQKLWAAD